MKRTLLVGLLVVVGCDGSDAEPVPGEPHVVAQALARGLADVAVVSGEANQLGRALYQPSFALPAAGDIDQQTCRQAVNDGLYTACELLRAQHGLECWGWAEFFWYYDVPRCHARVQVYDGTEQGLIETWVVDLSGRRYSGAAPQCGNGTLEPGEECDDGNNDDWDGCDASCRDEGFNGCETIIESQFAAAGIAEVRAADWTSPRSQVMTHRTARPLQPVTASLCNAAVATATDVCREITVQMPFVDGCEPQLEIVQSSGGAVACALRLEVWFNQTSPDNGVFTRAFTGLLSFEIPPI